MAVATSFVAEGNEGRGGGAVVDVPFVGLAGIDALLAAAADSLSRLPCLLQLLTALARRGLCAAARALVEVAQPGPPGLVDSIGCHGCPGHDVPLSVVGWMSWPLAQAVQQRGNQFTLVLKNRICRGPRSMAVPLLSTTPHHTHEAPRTCASVRPFTLGSGTVHRCSTMGALARSLVIIHKPPLE
ncbi:hypothetical protein H1V43_22405 [Streptomyces sp. PSKA54]|uniref:Uncharacterized protein n=1 Tax=Streptomyces himalayensis subsp. aureolus TaxID=2758039 RepID=A0A7W2HHI4_9ACTN|nr:hypothetical protein [Streptomyces himalayensis]MBA4864058.1 hypothetical protein [Streptomyces himalayensis subsp. aureolus]